MKYIGPVFLFQRNKYIRGAVRERERERERERISEVDEKFWAL